MNKLNKKHLIKYIAMAAVLIVCAAASLLFGSARLNPAEVFEGLICGGGTIGTIIRSVRLPRLLGAFLAGWGLSVSGVLLQTVTSNDLASPNIIGVNSGAGFAVILMLAFFPTATALAAPAAFVGALAATLLIIAISSRLGGGRVTVILGGMALTALLNAGISAVSLIKTDVVSVYNYFSIGGLSGIAAKRLILPFAFILVSYIAALLLSPRINTLCLGDGISSSLGTNVRAVRALSLICASASAAAAVSFAGLLGFVGLIVPHIARKLVGENTLRELLAAPLIGAALVTAADTFGRVILAPTELPVGLCLAAIGAPFFLILLMRRRKNA